MTKPRREPAIWLAAIVIALLFVAIDSSMKLVALYLIPLVAAVLVRLSFHLCIRVVNEYERLVILRMGRYIGTKGPGMVVVLPGIDNAQPIDTRVRFQEVPHESCITKDNARIDVDFLLYWRIRDPELAVLKIKGLEELLTGLATGLLRAVIGDISLDQALAEREHINQQLREKIDEVTEQWGIEVSTVEIREILMPADVQEIMSRQMAAERTRRATILEAEGYKQSAILRAEGEAEALTTLNSAAQTMGRNTLNLKYFDTLRRMAEGPSSKYIFPLEFSTLLRSIASSLERQQSSEALPDSPHTNTNPSDTLSPASAPPWNIAGPIQPDAAAERSQTHPMS